MRRKRTAGVFHIVKRIFRGALKTWRSRALFPAAVRRIPIPLFPFTMRSPAQLPAALVRSVFRCVPEIPARLHAVPLMSGNELVLPNFASANSRIPKFHAEIWNTDRKSVV